MAQDQHYGSRFTSLRDSARRWRMSHTPTYTHIRPRVVRTEPTHGSTELHWFRRAYVVQWRCTKKLARRLRLDHEILRSGSKEIVWFCMRVLVHGSRPFGTRPEGGVCHIRPHTPTYAHIRPHTPPHTPHTPTYIPTYT